MDLRWFCLIVLFRCTLHWHDGEDLFWFIAGDIMAWSPSRWGLSNCMMAGHTAVQWTYALRADIRMNKHLTVSRDQMVL